MCGGGGGGGGKGGGQELSFACQTVKTIFGCTQEQYFSLIKETKDIKECIKETKDIKECNDNHINPHHLL